MTAGTISDMPTQSPQTRLNGHTPTPGSPALPPVPTTRVGTTSAETRRRPDPHEERLRVIRTVGPKITWILRITYAVAAINALIGQVTGLGMKLPFAWYWAILPLAGTEFLAIVFAAVAQYRRKLGEGAYIAYGLAIGFSLFAVGVNWYGHADSNLFLAIFFAAFSFAGFVVFMIETAFGRRDHLWLQGNLDAPTPIYGLLQKIREPRVTARARLLAASDPNLGRAGSLAAAREQLAAEERRAKLMLVVKADLVRTLGGPNANLLTSVIDPDKLTAEIVEQAQLGDLASIYAARINPEQIRWAYEQATKRDKKLARQRPPERPAAPAGPTSAATSTPARVVVRSTAKGGGKAVAGRRPASEQWAALLELQAANPDRNLEIETKWFAQQLGVSEGHVRGLKRRAASGEFGGAGTP